MNDRLYPSLHGAREKLCVAQTDVTHDAHRRDLQTALDIIDRLGVFYCPQQWSKYDEPDMPDDAGGSMSTDGEGQ